MTDGLTDQHDLDALFTVTCKELRLLAAAVQRPPSELDPVSPTALVHEEWLPHGVTGKVIAHSTRRRNLCCP